MTDKLCYTEQTMNKKLLLFSFFLFSFLLLRPSVVNAQDVQLTNPAAPTPKSKLLRQIIVQNDLEEPIANLVIVCKQIPKKLDDSSENEIVTHELTTDSLGQTNLEVSETENFVFSCTSKTPTTTDYCWYFPNPTISFNMNENIEKNKPIYLVAQTSPDTCNKQYSEDELKKGIETLLPSGTPLPFNNKNLAYATPTPTPNIENAPTTENTETTLWQWIVQKIKALF